MKEPTKIKPQENLPALSEERLNEIVSSVIGILGPLTHLERDAVLIELIRSRGHWFGRLPETALQSAVYPRRLMRK